MAEAIIFDLYGTLIYINNKAGPYSGLIKELGLSPEESINAKNIALTESMESLADFINRIRPNAKVNLEDYEMQIKSELDSVRLFPETINIMEKLKENKIKIGMISNSSSPYKEPFFRLGVENLVDEYFFSCDIGMKKPDIAIYWMMLGSLNVKPNEALMIGDDIYCDVDGPKAIGINAILLDRGNASSSNPCKINSLDEIFKIVNIPSL